MSDAVLEYRLGDQVRLSDIAAVLETMWQVVEEPAEPLSRTFYDTFDWALYLDGGALERRSGSVLPTLVWYALDRETAALHQAAPTEPAFAADLPPGPVSARIAPACGIRRLLPIMALESRLSTVRLCNEDDKTVVRLRIEEARFRDPRSDSEGDLAVRLEAQAIRGYEDDYWRLLETLGDIPELTPAHRPRLIEALAAAGREAADYSSKLELGLDAEDRADRATKQILLGLLRTLEANVSGARANLDSEFLHDLRVATRRTRSGLGQIRGVFAEDRVAYFKASFAWLQQATGPVRDLDVYLLDFDGYLASLPLALRAHLERLRAFLLSHYAAEQRRLSDTLGSERFATLTSDWRAFLEAAVPDHPAQPNAGRTIKAVADEQIWRLVKRVRREGRRIGPDSPATDLHELRKSCKKLRYLMEFFQSLYPDDEIRGLIRLMKTLLDNLGSYQDLAVQAAHLRDLAERMRDEGQGQTDTLLAVGALVGNLLGRQQAARDTFDAVFAGFLKEEHQRVFRSLFAPRSREDATG